VSAVVFDMDGILTDTEVIWDDVRRGLAREDGVAWPEDATERMMGMSTSEWSAYLSRTVGLRGSPEEVAERAIERVTRRLDEHLPLMPGAVEAVRRMAGRWPVGLASSAPRRLIDAVLEALELSDRFGATVSTEEVPAGKPAPDGYLLACERLGVDPARSVAVEDSSNGLRSAAAAGMAVVAVPHPGHPPAADALALAAARLASLDELTERLVAGLR